MATQHVSRRSSLLPSSSGAKPNASPIYVDSDDNILKIVPAASGTTEVQVIDASSVQTLTNKTLTAPLLSFATVPYTSGTSLSITQALHAGRVIYVTDVASLYVLPAATGSGDRYTIVLGASQTGAGNIKPTAPGTFIGNATLYADGGATVVGFAAGATDNTIDLFGTANSTGGLLGASYRFTDVATNVYHVDIVSDAGGTEATPFSTV